MRFLLVIMLLLSGCHCSMPHQMDGQVYYTKRQQIYDIYQDRDIERLYELLEADNWLLEHHKKCAILTNEESLVLQERIELLNGMIAVIRTIN